MIDSGYRFTCEVDYPNNQKLVKQIVDINKDLTIKTVTVTDNEGNTQIKMTFNKIDMSPTFDKDYFELSNILTIEDDNTVKDNDTSSAKKDDSNTSEDDSSSDTNTSSTATIEDIIYPMYLPNNTYLTSQEKVDTDAGERLILTFDGDNPFILVEETIAPTESSLIIPTSGDLEFLSDVIGVVNDNSISWDSNGIEYYVVSDTLTTSELIEIAKSISVLPVSK